MPRRDRAACRGFVPSNLLSSHIAGRMPVTYTDFSPIALLVTGSYYALTVAADSPLKSAKDFMDLLKKNPSAVAVGLGSAARIRKTITPLGLEAFRANLISSLFSSIACIVRAPRSNLGCMNSSCICP